MGAVEKGVRRTNREGAGLVHDGRADDGPVLQKADGRSGLSRPADMGVGSFVGPPRVVTTGAKGGVVSAAVIVTATGTDPGTDIAGTSVSWTVRVCEPSPSGLIGLTAKDPVWPTTAVPMTTPFSTRLTVLPASPVPEIEGVVSIVEPPPAVTTGAAGAVVSIVTLSREPSSRRYSRPCPYCPP